MRPVVLMIPVLEAIAPIFFIIICGYCIQRAGILHKGFLIEANRFIFYWSLPFLIFTGIVKSGTQAFALHSIVGAILPSFVLAAIALCLGVLLGLRKGRLGTFIQTSFHGNVSYIGLAVLVLLLGEGGLVKGSILIGFLILANNALAIAILSCASRNEPGVRQAFLSVVKNPVIVATFAGIFVVYAGVSIPGVLTKTMVMLANVALPMALIIIGASMSLGVIRRSLKLASLVTMMKLLLLPAISVMYCRFYQIPWPDALPGVILLATPTAVTSYTLAQEIGGDPDLASNAVTLSTILSPLSFLFWAVMIQPA